ncbi:MAG: molybdopterin-synthase adenylyltransferase MoeB [Chitinophagales bacterium]
MQEITLSPEELERYSRHIRIPEFNREGQEKLKAAKVLVVGAGGLGSPLLLYLAAAGVGTIGIVDFDTVELSNLQRQVLFSVDDVGKAKTAAAKAHLLRLNPYINIITYEEPLSSRNAMQIVKNYDVVADGTDNFPTRYLVNDACVFAGIPNVYASIHRFVGQVAVFNYNNGPNYRDVFPEPPPPGTVPSCAEGGVLGVLPGIIGSMQANEVIKICTGIGEPLSGRLFTFDALHFTTQLFKINKDPNNPITGVQPTITALIDYNQFCSGNEGTATATIREITVQELKQMQDNAADFQLIDVREPEEYKTANLGGTLIPVSKIGEHLNQIARDKKVIIHCKSGARSLQAIRQLQAKGFSNIYQLKGGILAYAKEIDPNLLGYI